MIFAVTTAQMKQAEELSEKKGVTRATLMQNAAEQCLEAIKRRIGKTAYKRFAILCGSGNNGGDGAELAALLREEGGEVTLLLTDGLPDTPTARACMERHGEKPSAISCKEAPDAAKSLLKSADVIIDCVFGTGFHGELPPVAAEMLAYANAECNALKIAVDIPSGINGDSGEIADNAFRSDMTLVLGAMKTGLLNHPACEYCGEMQVLDIGISDGCYTEYEAVFTPPSIMDKLPPRPIYSNKGDFGKLLNVAGSVSYIGATILSSKAALRIGTGLVTLASTEYVIGAAAAAMPECVYLPLYQDDRGYIYSANAKLLCEAAEKATAVSVGCGMGNNENTAKLTEALIKSGNCPIILDADGINCISDNINVLKDNDRPIILTPHPGEFARLLGISVAEVQAHRLERAKRFAEDYGVVLLLKGMNTVIAAPDGRAAVNPTGSNALSKAGCGDVLTGMIAGLAAQGAEAYDAAVLGAYIHGRCADRLVKTRDPSSVLAGELVECLGKI
ncbi:MAG: NAD(P)H-hydrate dehydratase [Oscillospiraceae bacterium]|nr:NAD(P)H-hydrate dehydratase [Oscillospiraceae bacterium]